MSTARTLAWAGGPGEEKGGRVPLMGLKLNIHTSWACLLHLQETEIGPKFSGAPTH